VVSGRDCQPPGRPWWAPGWGGQRGRFPCSPRSAGAAAMAAASTLRVSAGSIKALSTPSSAAGSRPPASRACSAASSVVSAGRCVRSVRRPAAAVQDLHRRGRSHDRDLRARPRRGPRWRPGREVGYRRPEHHRPRAEQRQQQPALGQRGRGGRRLRRSTGPVDAGEQVQAVVAGVQCAPCNTCSGSPSAGAPTAATSPRRGPRAWAPGSRPAPRPPGPVRRPAATTPSGSSPAGGAEDLAGDLGRRFRPAQPVHETRPPAWATRPTQDRSSAGMAAGMAANQGSTSPIRATAWVASVPLARSIRRSDAGTRRRAVTQASLPHPSRVRRAVAGIPSP
jgi:hypothetical protein